MAGCYEVVDKYGRRQEYDASGYPVSLSLEYHKINQGKAFMVQVADDDIDTGDSNALAIGLIAPSTIEGHVMFTVDCTLAYTVTLTIKPTLTNGTNIKGNVINVNDGSTNTTSMTSVLGGSNATALTVGGTGTAFTYYVGAAQGPTKFGGIFGSCNKHIITGSQISIEVVTNTNDNKGTITAAWYEL